jgi:hypothetical protein
MTHHHLWQEKVRWCGECRGNDDDQKVQHEMEKKTVLCPKYVFYMCVQCIHSKKSNCFKMQRVQLVAKFGKCVLLY